MEGAALPQIGKSNAEVAKETDELETAAPANCMSTIPNDVWQPLLGFVVSCAQSVVQSLNGESAVAMRTFEERVQRLSGAFMSPPTTALSESSQAGDPKLNVTTNKGFHIGDHILLGSGPLLETGLQVKAFGSLVLGNKKTGKNHAKGTLVVYDYSTQLENLICEGLLVGMRLRNEQKPDEAGKMDEMVTKLEAVLVAHLKAEAVKKEAEMAGMIAELAESVQTLAPPPLGTFDKVYPTPVPTFEWRAVLVKNEYTGADLQDAAHVAHQDATGFENASDGLNQLALQVDAAAQKKLTMDWTCKEQEAKSVLKEAGEDTRALVGRLPALYTKLLELVSQIEHSRVGRISKAKIREAAADAKTAAVELRADESITDRQGEADNIEKIEGKLALALTKQLEAKELRKEALVIHAALEVAAEAAALADAAGALADKLEAAGLTEEAAKLHEFQAVLENSESTGKDLQDAAHGAHELAEKLRADGHLELADEMDTAVSGVLDSIAWFQVCIACSSPLDMLHTQAVGTLALTFTSLCTVE